jgi:hypothetical protein
MESVNDIDPSRINFLTGILFRSSAPAALRGDRGSAVVRRFLEQRALAFELP